MERSKKCRYCQKEFTAKRIDAKYCSDSCRQMGYRRDVNPEIYGKVVPIYFELDDNEYAEVLKKAEGEGMHPNEYVKELLTKEEEFIRVRFTYNDWTTKINALVAMYDDISPEKLVRDLFLKAAEREFREYKG
ncbi:MAG: hypothetical protein L3J66_14010 [Bacteroidales bacterium]|nr:hypothetical protein [Bacteroidales bacterium]